MELEWTGIPKISAILMVCVLWDWLPLQIDWNFWKYLIDNTYFRRDVKTKAVGSDS